MERWRSDADLHFVGRGVGGVLVGVERQRRSEPQSLHGYFGGIAGDYSRPSTMDGSGRSLGEALVLVVDPLSLSNQNSRFL